MDEPNEFDVPLDRSASQDQLEPSAHASSPSASIPLQAVIEEEAVWMQSPSQIVVKEVVDEEIEFIEVDAKEVDRKMQRNQTLSF